MSNGAPRMVIIAGPNGAGKSTFESRVLRHLYGPLTFLNADDIARDLSPDAPERAAFEAGRAMLHRLRDLIGQPADFAIETTLAGRSFVRHVNDARRHGYKVHLYFLQLASPDLAVARVSQRVRVGGHNIPEDVIRRRYHAGVRNFLGLYRPLADEWYVYDNSDYDTPMIVAAGSRDQTFLGA